MRIMFMIDNLNIGGAQRHLVRLIAGLQESGIQAEVVAFGEINEELKSFVREGTVHRVSMESIKHLSFCQGFAQLMSLLRKKKPTIVHTYLNTANAFGSIAAKIAGVPLIISSRRDMGHFRTGRVARLEKFVNRFCEKIVCVSEAVRQQTIMSEGIDKNKAIVLYTGIDSNDFQRNKTPIPSKNECFTVGMVATMDREIKGHRDFIEAAKQVVQNRKDVYFVLIGDGQLRASLENYVHEQKLDDHVVFKGSSKNVKGEIAKMDIFVMPSHSEGFSNAILESMSMEVPVVAHAIEGNLEVIEDGKSGYLVPLQSIKDMANRIEDLLESRSKIEQFGKNARNRILSEFTVDHMVVRYQNMYQSLIDQRGLN